MDQPDNIIDLMPYIEGQKFGWTVDMTHAVLKQGVSVPVLEPKTAVDVWIKTDRTLPPII